jgi:hypothetical protein
VSTYCGERLIRACLEDLEHQTIGSDVEIIVIDSGSPEDERSIVEELQQTYTNIVYVRTEHETLYRSWNRALELAHGTYFANVNIDDWLRHDTLELFARALDRYASADLAYSHWAATDVPRGEPSPVTNEGYAMHPPYVPSLPLFYCYSGCVQFWRRSSLLALGGFDPTFAACGDLDMLVRLTAQCGTSVLVPALLQGHYSNPGGISRASRDSDAEQRTVFTRARALPIDVLYDLPAAQAETAAAAWTDLGNLAYQIRVPWHVQPLRDSAFALDCYERALAHLGDYLPAAHNRYAVLLAVGRQDEAEHGVASLTPERAAVARGADFALIDPVAVPRCRGPVFEPDRGVKSDAPARSSLC